MSRFQLYIQGNSPGEISAWVAPFVREFMLQEPDTDVTICLVPCQYASGKEFDIASSIPGVTKVMTAKETLRYVATPAPFFSKIDRGAVMYLGGDPMYARRLSKKLKLPCFAYTEHDHFQKKGFRQVFYKSSDGDLMVDRILRFSPDMSGVWSKYGLDSAKQHILFLSGSRPQHFRYLLPYYLDLVEWLRDHGLEFEPVLGVSPFISDSDLSPIQSRLDELGLSVTRGDSLELMSMAELIVTIPGTNTAEAMYLGKPMQVFLPLNHPQALIFDGLAGLLAKVPFLGALICRLAIWIIRRRMAYFSLPNRISDREIVPELVGVLTVESGGNAIMALMTNQTKLRDIESDLRTLRPTESPLPRMVRTILG